MIPGRLILPRHTRALALAIVLILGVWTILSGGIVSLQALAQGAPDASVNDTGKPGADSLKPEAPPADAAAPAATQDQGAPATTSPRPSLAAASATGKAALDEAELTATIKLLEDPAAREQFLGQLKALQAGMKTVGATSSTRAETLVDKVTGKVNLQVQAVVDTAKAVLASIATLPNLADWLAFQASNEYRRAFWFSVFEGVGLTLVGGLVLVMLLTHFVRRYTSRVRLNPAHGSFRRGLRRLWVLLLDVLPAIGFFIAGSIVLRVLPLADVTIDVGTLGVLCFAIGHLLWMSSHHVFAPRDKDWRWLKLSDEDALALRRFSRGIGLLSLDGYFLLVAADRLGLPASLHTVLSHILFIIICGWMSVWLVRHRAAIAKAVRRLGASRLALLRDVLPWEALAARGHLLLIGLVWLYYLVWAIDVPGGFSYLFIATLATAAIAVVFQLGMLVLHRLQRRADRSSPLEETDTLDPAPRRAGDAIVFGILAMALRALAILALLQVWGLNILGWLHSPTGARVLERGLRIGIIILIAIALWLALDRAITRYLTAMDAHGNIKHSNRSRTLANIGRNVVLVVICLFAAATVLSEVGVDTGPLLAGAGVVGLAIGFGSQALVKDIITGLFILLGDTMRVGDVVDLGGQSGAVETMSMRAVVLRAYNGSVMTIPYGSITTITNLTKDFSFAVFNVALTYRANIDAVYDMLRELDEQIRGEWPYRRIILAPLEIAGVDKFLDSSVVILARLKTRPGDQWRVQREFNKRINQALNERGIEIPYPHQTVYFRDGSPMGAREAALAGEATLSNGDEAATMTTRA
ncbi:small conductance mechanosensitive channel [Arboricoccus pini]|uniref:Small conductance mechanosensitive channel n=1 Tax=Arboricoccus pini TaxID=1963835 RepID=A0A212PYZ9_9PROT|nr:mechanosensitive ion channel domain-containing protein [Arboricoccus pini]SNB52209.1 small conductance mechanosensitive channel [Arboricoccus pini]